MSKQYKVNMNIDVSKATPNGGYIRRRVPTEKDPKNPDAEFDKVGFKLRTGAEVFAFLSEAAINGANRECGFQALKGFRQVIRNLKKSVATGDLIANRSDLDVIKNSIDGNTGWPNTDEMFDVLEVITNAIANAEIMQPTAV